jgi:CRISPR-associated protein Cas1
MGWRSIVISNPAKLTFAQNALQITQGEGANQQTAKVPLEDIATLVIDEPQVNLTAKLLSACADAHIAVITVAENHLPNGVLLPYLPHSRALKIMRAQLALSVPNKKRIWQQVVQQKISNQAAVLTRHTGNKVAMQRLFYLARSVRSGDPDNTEGQAAQVYFRALFDANFSRQQENFYNAALNYGYAVIRASIARSLCSYGFLPAFGLFHHNELNSFNLADDLIEPYRPLLDAYVLKCFPKMGIAQDDLIRRLKPSDKALLVGFLHQDIHLNQHAGDTACTALAAIETTVISLSQMVQAVGSSKKTSTELNTLAMPILAVAKNVFCVDEKQLMAEAL